MSAKPLAACRAFEERLLAHLDIIESSAPPAAAQMAVVRPLAGDEHATVCASCSTLTTDLSIQRALFGALRRPEAAPPLVQRLLLVPTDFPLRREAAKVLELLEPGVLASPAPSPELMSRLVFLPTRGRSERPEGPTRVPFVAFVTTLRSFLGDWRILVAGAYAVMLLLVTVLKIDPLSVARGTATELTTAGERAIAEARTVAADKLAPLEKAAQPLTARLDYRVYRTLAAGRARAVAYSQLLFERVFGGSSQATAARDARPARSLPEPAGAPLRS